MTQIIVSGLVKHFAGVEANRGVNFTVPSGALAGLLGPNGAGKTTLVRQIVGILRPDAGVVLLGGRDVADDPGWARQSCAYLPQTVLPLMDATVEEALTFAGRLRGVPRRKLPVAIAEQLDNWSIGQHRKSKIQYLSGGERRIAALACAFMGDREVLVLDEPTNELDPLRRQHVWDLLTERRASGTTVLVITHNVHEIDHLVTHVGVMSQGCVVAEGTPHDLRAAAGFGGDTLTIELQSGPEDDGLAAEFALQWLPARRSWVGSIDRREANGALAHLSLPGSLTSLRLGAPSLADVYVRLVGAAAPLSGSRTG